MSDETKSDMRTRIIWALGVVAASLVAPGATSAPAGASTTVSPPSSIASDCSVDVSSTLGAWLRAQPPDTTVVMTGDCYQVDEGLRLTFPTDLTIEGGTFENLATTPPPRNGHAAQLGFPAFNVLGGSGVAFDNVDIEGANPSGGYDASMAFAGGIELQGTAGATISDVAVSSVFGDGITLAPLRGGKNHNTGKILSPVTDVTVTGLTVDGAGRMGVTFGSVDGATLTNLSLSNVGLDTFDMEADQGNEGAEQVTVNGCTASSAVNSNLARTFFSNGGLGAGARTGNVTVENCTMTEPQGTAALQLLRPGTGSVDRGPFSFVDDTFACGQSMSASLVACVDVSGTDVTVQGCTFTFPTAPPIEAVYSATSSSVVDFDDDTVTGYGTTGTSDTTSTVNVTGGTWTSAS